MTQIQAGLISFMTLTWTMKNELGNNGDLSLKRYVAFRGWDFH